MKCASILWRAIKVFSAVLSIGCATVHHDPLYDGDPVVIPDTWSDSTTLVPITIVNSRVRDAIDPHFYFLSNGRHPLGIVHGLGEKKTLFVDTKWIRSDGAITIVAHYPSGGDFVYETFYWKPGLRIDVSLDDIFNPIAAWAHR